MTLAGIKAGDLVECDIKGRRFYAEVLGRSADHPAGEGLVIQPITSGISYRHATAHQVVEHYRKRRPRRPARTAAAA